ncbi:hypothetical protein OG216_43215 [Streptomycetaceae bacterium NBC_01309]
MFLTDNPDPRNEDPDDRRRDRTVFAPGRPDPGPAWQPVCRRRHASATETDTETDGDTESDTAPAPATRSAQPLTPFAPRTPSARPAAARRVLVPVHTTGHGTDVVRFFKDPVGHRVAVAFTSVALLRNVCGADQRWTEMAEECLRETIAGLGVETIVRDPRLSAAPVQNAAPARHDAPHGAPAAPPGSSRPSAA